jgi:hypothetical protein
MTLPMMRPLLDEESSLNPDRRSLLAHIRFDKPIVRACSNPSRGLRTLSRLPCNPIPLKGHPSMDKTQSSEPCLVGYEFRWSTAWRLLQLTRAI